MQSIKLSELATTSIVSANDKIIVLTTKQGTTNTQLVSLNNLTSSLSASNTIPLANTLTGNETFVIYQNNNPVSITLAQFKTYFGS